MGPHGLPHPRFRFLKYAVTLVAVCVGPSPVVFAQDAAQAPAHLAIVDGRATLEREGEIEDAAGGVPFVTGDRLRTEAGRVEIIFPDGSSLDVDEFTAIDLLSPTLVRMTAGRTLLRVAGADNPSEAVRYQIDTTVASVVTDGPGEFRVALFSGPSGVETELAVLRGWASLTTERGSTAVRAGERSLARDTLAPTPAQTFNSARFDAFDRWAEARRVERAGAAASARYLPEDLRVYGGTFDRNGTWQYEAPYGYVWYPAVAQDWRPYFDGYWSAVQPYGWTWIGFDVWSWPTHHYGRWGYTSSRWYWIPERRWASAWVSWGAAPGYVSWCPLGFDNRPVFGLSVHVGSSWAGWTVVPRSNFGRDHVRRWAVDSRRLGGDLPRLTSGRAPVLPPPTHAVPRNASGVAGARAGAVAEPRALGTQQSPVSSRQPLAASRRSPVVGQPAEVGGGRAAEGRSPNRNPRSAIGPQTASPGQQSPVGNRPAGSENAGGRWAVPRQPSRVEDTPTLGSVPTLDRTTPNAQRRQQADGWLRQPLPQATPRPNPRTPAASDAAPRGNPNASPQRNPDAAPRGRDGVPTWTTPGAEVTRPSTPRAVRPADPVRPQIELPGNAQPRSPGPRWSGYGETRGRSQPSRTEPQSENRSSAPAARERSTPAYRGQGAAAPRGGSEGSRPSGSDSGGRSSAGSGTGGRSSAGTGAGSGARSSSGSGGGGARQRHP